MPVDDFRRPPIDAAVWRELQDTAGADFAAELAHTFIDEAPAMLAALRAGQALRDAAALRRTAHALKANALTFGATPLADLARTIELHGLDAADGAALAALEQAYAHSASALKALAGG